METQLELTCCLCYPKIRQTLGTLGFCSCEKEKSQTTRVISGLVGEGGRDATLELVELHEHSQEQGTNAHGGNCKQWHRLHVSTHEKMASVDKLYMDGRKNLSLVIH